MGITNTALFEFNNILEEELAAYNESLDENSQDIIDKIIDNYNYYKNRNNAGLLSVKEKGLKAFEEFSTKYPNLRKTLQSKIKDDFKKDLVKSNIGLAIQSIDLLNESLNEEAQKEVFDKPGEFWYFTKHGIGPGSVPKDINIEKIIEGDGGEYFLVKDKILSTSALNKYEIKEKVPKNISEEYSLVGQDGNAFSLMGYTARCMRKCGFKKADIDEMRERAMSGDYNNLIVVCDEYIQKCNDTLDYDDMYESYKLNESSDSEESSEQVISKFIKQCQLDFEVSGNQTDAELELSHDLDTDYFWEELRQACDKQGIRFSVQESDSYDDFTYYYMYVYKYID